MPPFYDDGDTYPDRRFRQGGNPLLPPDDGGGGGGGGVPVIGWLDPYGGYDGGETAAHANAGTIAFGPATNYNRVGPLYAGVVGYVSGTVVWSLNWQQLDDDPTPTLSAVDGRPDLICVNWPATPSTFAGVSLGLVTLTATLNSTPTAAGQGLVASTSDLNYSEMAWGPEP